MRHKPESKIIILFIVALNVLFFAAPAFAKRSSDTIAILGIWTPVRFKRGELDDYIPANWDLGFFEKERSGLNITLRDSFSTMMGADLNYKVVPTSSFERIADKMYTRSYISYEIDDVMKRFVWSEVEKYCDMLDVRYAMFGDVTKVDVSNPDAIQLEMYVIVYDSQTHAIVYMQQFANAGRMAREYSADTLRRHHPDMDEDIIWFLRNPLGRAALIVYNDFLGTVSGDMNVDFSNAVSPPMTDGTTPAPDGSTPVYTPPVVVPQPAVFNSSPACSENGAALIMSASSGNNHVLMAKCEGGSFKLVQNQSSIFNNYNGGVWAAVGDFETRGAAELALSATSGNDDIRMYGVNGKIFDFNTIVNSLFDAFKGYDGGAYVSAGDFDGDGIDELIVSLMEQRNEVGVYKMKNNTHSMIGHLVMPYPNFGSGVIAAAGDFDGDGTDELALSPITGGADVRVYRYTGTDFDPNPMASLYGFFPNYQGGCFIAAGDFDGDGVDELAAAPASGNSSLKVFKLVRGSFQEIESVYQAVPTYENGIQLAAADFDADGTDELVVSFIKGKDQVRILHFVNGKLNADNPMAVFHDIYPAFDGHVIVTAGVVPELWRR